mmetsp:Transcript_14631/g.48005  ORF Transcript_14631/g.48005 Transcript_14631/m.48005 type:complete len:92 (-) Transcript_14631:350-625(-)
MASLARASLLMLSVGMLHAHPRALLADFLEPPEGFALADAFDLSLNVSPVLAVLQNWRLGRAAEPAAGERAPDVVDAADVEAEVGTEGAET